MQLQLDMPTSSGYVANRIAQRSDDFTAPAGTAGRFYFSSLRLAGKVWILRIDPNIPMSRPTWIASVRPRFSLTE